jgi:hypothetical protein
VSHPGLHHTSPENIVFNRDMFLNISLIADWHAITLKREHFINEIKNKDVMIISLTTIRVRAGTKNSRTVDFLQ